MKNPGGMARIQSEIAYFVGSGGSDHPAQVAGFDPNTGSALSCYSSKA